MPALQTDYTSAPPIGVPGQIATTEKSNIVSAVVKNGPLAFGVVTAHGDATNTFQPMAAARRPAGISVQAKEVPETNTDQYPNDYLADVITTGTVYVEIAGSVVPGDPVTFNDDGTFAAAGTNTLSGAEFATAATDGIVMVRLS